MPRVSIKMAEFNAHFPTPAKADLDIMTDEYSWGAQDLEEVQSISTAFQSCPRSRVP
jgi:hypothetical protein